jgi:BirA family biotin operon repressor/biotin-[acetyl-CoA-carboxylase] ligase
MNEKPLSADLIRNGLGTRSIGRDVLYFAETTSTNEIAIGKALAGAAEGMVVVAGKQTRGRGRLKRAWSTPEGNIALSVILYPDIPALHALIMMASLAVVHAIENVTGLHAGIKWPNDVLINGKKVCGILIETDVRNDRVRYTVTGIGINVNIGESDLAGVLTPATSLMIETGKEVSRLDLIRELLRDMDRMYLSVTSGGSVFREWQDRLVTLGTEIRATSVNEVIEGVAESVDADGSLLVRDAAGMLRRIVAGDVTLRR